ncbi:cation-translocating P-type ATPase [Clostridium nigeriense]|uniref:cation-translocating P-type ATPase n=1 Tax=Clostridium nigeriense TaxID=1805470 RepID=UPI000833C47C|nr:cation-translocating P-type ATPase [Clostridium nigeriense]
MTNSTISTNSNQFLGLTNEEVKIAQEKHGKNLLISEKKENFLFKILDVLKEPMFLLLLFAASIYFILGEPRDGTIMLIFVIGVIGIDVIQEWKTDKTLKALKDLSAPHIKVIRNGSEITIKSEDLVPGDLMIINEGVKIPADGEIIKCNDLCVDESSLTGESQGVWKNTNAIIDGYWRNDYCYAGTLVIQGNALVRIANIGSKTEYGKIGINVSKAPKNITPLQKQTKKLVKICAYISTILFIFVCLLNYINLSHIQFKYRLIQSILSGITLAMAMIPEEFPVILTVFLSMGAWRLAKKNSLVKNLNSVETLGSVSVLCVDKTGTITMNKMSVTDIWSIKDDEKELIKIMGMACETEAYDPMEKAMLQYCQEHNICEENLFSGELVKEYSFTNERKMMGHIWKLNNKILLTSKGSPEKILSISKLDENQKQYIESKINEMSSRGLRVIAIAKMKIEDETSIPSTLEECTLEFLGLIGLQDPPRKSVKTDISHCIKAGIRVVMITGDNGITASAIAKEVGIPNSNEIITGDMLDVIDDNELKEKIKSASIFSRVIPAHKMRIVKAFKENGEIVAMTGDGVNDAPALKYADIGIAMGHRGSEVSREAADLVLLDDNFSTIVDTIENGRRIYDNIRKAIGYVFTIHIPIALSSLIAPILGITSSSLFLLPLHVVLLELIIDPTCSVVLERQPAEKNIMNRKPRNFEENILSKGTLIKSIIQGLVLFATSFGAYYIYLNNTSPEVARSIGLSIIMLSNLLLVYVNSSNTDCAYKSFLKLFKDKVMWLVSLITLFGIGIILYTPLSKVLSLSPLSFKQLALVILISIVTTLWYDLIKLINKK